MFDEAGTQAHRQDGPAPFVLLSLAVTCFGCRGPCRDSANPCRRYHNLNKSGRYVTDEA